MMIDWLAPAIVVALLGLILQGMKAAYDLYDRKEARQAAKHQSNISLCVALMQLTDAMSHKSDGERLEIKEKLIKAFVSNVLPGDIGHILDL